MKNSEQPALKFSQKIARQVAEKSFGHVTDCILGYADSGYDLQSYSGEDFEQNFEEDLREMGLVSNERRIRICAKQFDKLKDGFEKYIRRRYYK